MGEGADVRRAMDGPDLEHDAFIGHLLDSIADEHARSADASESAAKTTVFIEQTGINSQANSWCKTILKKLPKKDGQAKAMDIILSLETALPMIKAHVGGQGTGDMFPDAGGDADKIAAAVGGDAPDGTDAELTQDQEDFDEHAEQVDGDEETVQPIDFPEAAE